MLRSYLLAFMFILPASCSQEDQNRNIEIQIKNNAKDEEQNPTNLLATPDTDIRTEKWNAEQEEMTAFLNLTEQEKEDLKTAFAKREEEHSKWMLEKGKKLHNLEQEMLRSARNRDLSRMKRTKALAVPLRDEIRGLLKKHSNKIANTLSKENQDIWKGHQLSEKLLTLMSSIDLSKEQTTSIQEEAVKVVKKSYREPNPAAAGFLKLEKTVERKIINHNQKKAYAKIKLKFPMRSLDFSKSDLKSVLKLQAPN